MAYFEPIPTPPDAKSDDPTQQIGRAASPKKRRIGRLLWLRNGPDEDMELAEARLRPLRRVGVGPARLGGMLSPAWTATDEKLHPRWPKGAPDGKGGQFMRPGQHFVLDGREWEIAHIVGGKIIAHDASGKYDKVESKVFDPAETAGPKTELTGAKPAPPRPIQGGKGSVPKPGKSASGKPSDVTVVSAYVEPETHKPELKLPENSKLTEEQWQRFGELEQLHYIDLMERFGPYKASKTRGMVQNAYKQFDEAIQNFVSGSIGSQFSGSSGYTLSLTSKLSNATENKEVAQTFAEREKALELINLIRDAVAWDLYNRTGGPDVVMTHKDNDYKGGTSWWTEKFIKGKEIVFSGLSQSHHFRRTFWSSQTGIISPISIRHILVAEYVSGVKKGASKSTYTSEREMAVPYQLKVDERSLSFHNNEMPQSALKWLEDVTATPTGAPILEQFRDSVENGTPLPIPPPPPDIKTEGQSWLPPPQGALDAMAEYAEVLPEIEPNVIDPADLPKDLPWEHLDENGKPESRVAQQSGYEPGDFMLGLKGTLYWIGPDPDDDSGFGLRYHKIIPDGKGGLVFVGESWNFEGGGKNEYFKLKGNVPPTKPPDLEPFDANAWAFPDSEPIPIALHKKGDKFKVDGIPYEIVGDPEPGWTKIRSLDSGKLAKINSDYQTVILVPVEGVAAASKKLVPKKGLTLGYHNKRHIVTAVKKDGTVSIKPSGGKVVVLPPDHPALGNLFDPSAWERDEKTTKMGDLTEGTLFHGGGLKSKKITPYKVTKIDKDGVHWLNLDTEAEGVSKATKKVRRLKAIGGGPEQAEQQPQTTKIDPNLPTYDTEWENVKVGDVVMVGNDPEPKVVELIGKVSEGYTVKFEGEGGSVMVGDSVKVKSQTPPTATPEPEQEPEPEPEPPNPEPTTTVISPDEEVLTEDDEDTIDNLAPGSIIKIPSSLGDGPWMIVITKQSGYLSGNIVHPNAVGTGIEIAEQLEADGWPTGLDVLDNAPLGVTKVLLNQNTKFGEIVSSVKKAQATSSAIGEVTLVSKKVDGIAETDLENATVGSKVIVKVVIPAPNQPEGSTTAIWTKKPNGQWRKNTTILSQKTSAELAASLALSSQIGVTAELVRQDSVITDPAILGTLPYGTVIKITTDDNGETSEHENVVAGWMPLGDDSNGTPIDDETMGEVIGASGYTVTIAQPANGPGDPEQDQTIDELPDLTPDFKPYKTANKVGDYLYRSIESLPPGTVIQDKAKNNYEVVKPGGIARVTDGSQEYQINGSLIARVVEGAKLEKVPEQAATDISGTEIPQGGKVYYLTSNDLPELSDLEVGDRLMGDPTSQSVQKQQNYELVADTDNGMVFARLDENLEKTSSLKQIAGKWMSQVSEVWDVEGETGGPAQDPLSLLQPGDEFENALGQPFALVAIESEKAFVKDLTSGKMIQVSPFQSQDQMAPAPASAPVDTTQPEPIGVINGQPLTQEQIDWVIAKPPLGISGYKSAWSNSGTFKNPQLAELPNGTTFRGKGSNDAYVLVQSLGGGWVLVYRPDTGELGRVTAETRVRVEAKDS